MPGSLPGDCSSQGMMWRCNHPLSFSLVLNLAVLSFPIHASLFSSLSIICRKRVLIPCSAYNGQECHDHFSSNPHKVQVILMDLQVEIQMPTLHPLLTLSKMPLIDGMLATKMIRQLEKELEGALRTRPRVPIIAVSASLTEDNRFEYLQSGYVF